MRSGLVLAGANDVWNPGIDPEEDEVLAAQEVAHIDLRNTNLVVMSACETGLGDIRGSEGVYGSVLFKADKNARSALRRDWY